MRTFTDCGSRIGSPRPCQWLDARIVTAATVRKFARSVYGPVTLFTGNVVFDEIGVLQAHEFDGETIFDVPDHAALRLADRDNDANRWPQVRRNPDRSARLREVNHTAGDIRAVRQDEPRHRIARRETIVAAIFRPVQDLPVCEPG